MQGLAEQPLERLDVEEQLYARDEREGGDDVIEAALRHAVVHPVAEPGAERDEGREQFWRKVGGVLRSLGVGAHKGELPVLYDTGTEFLPVSAFSHVREGNGPKLKNQ